jgi:DNA-binding CsgD family transcriptional regulator
MDYAWAAGCSAWALATVELRRDRADDAAAHLAEALEGFEAVGDVRGIAQCLEAAATLVSRRRDCKAAARLLGAAGALRAQLAAPLPDEDKAEHDALLQRVRRALRPQAAEQARREGRDMPVAAAIAVARTAVTESVESPELPNPLTGREREVALLVARGRTNRQIGRALGIAEKTTEVHVHNIIRKLGACSRAEVAAWVATRER